MLATPTNLQLSTGVRRGLSTCSLVSETTCWKQPGDVLSTLAPFQATVSGLIPFIVGIGGPLSTSICKHLVPLRILYGVEEEGKPLNLRDLLDIVDLYFPPPIHFSPQLATSWIHHFPQPIWTA